jgi:hypothetical protein
VLSSLPDTSWTLSPYATLLPLTAERE